MYRRIFISFSMMFIAYSGWAQDRLFTYTYQTNVLPAGVKELEYWSTLRSGKNTFYNAIDQRFELELGLGKNVQTAFYFNAGNEFYRSGDEILHTSFTGFSNEWKFKLSDPVVNKIGTALYAEVGFDGRELELEGKIILDKKINNNIFAVNFVGEYEMEYKIEDDEAEFEIETPVELDLAYMHLLGSHAGAGIEVRNHNEINEDEGWENSVWYAGPVVHFNGNNWFVNFTFLPQLFNAKKEEGITDRLELSAHEKVEARLLVSFSF